MNRICVFCGSSMGFRESYKIMAENLAQHFLKENITLVYGGANVGLMKILADTILKNNGEVIGIMPKNLVEKEVAHNNLTELIVVNSMQERKLLMAEMSDAFIAMPGGFGTFDELAEMLTFNQLRIHDKPVGLLDVENYFLNLLLFFDHAVNEGFVREEHRDNIIVENSVASLLKKLKSYSPVKMDKWIKDIKKESYLH
ncbi:MAG: TIGR00730 family Rossman fold protein [Bacteroidales bacterium]|nr:TIGR00730 family Rossman fold protein [Bacteroidales bacterium]